MKKNLVIYGIGKFAEYVGYVFENDSDFDLKAYCIEEALLSSDQFAGKPLIGFETFLKKFPPEEFVIFIAVGNNKLREKFYLRAQKAGYNFASYISSKSRYWKNLVTGKNVFIDEGCVLQPFVEIGDNCILFASNIAHHTKIGNHCLISVCTTGGNVKIGEHCYMGLNTSIKQNLQIADNSIIGMGCVIEKDILQSSVYSHKGTTKRNLDPEQISRLFLK